MRRILKHYIADTLALYIASQLASGMVFEKGYETLFLAGVALTIGTILAKPVINLLLLPINLITFGLFKWVSSAIALYLVTLVIQGFRIDNFFFAGLSTNLIDIPSFASNGIMAYIIFSLLLSFVTSILFWILK